MMESPLLSGSCRCCASEGAYKDVKSSYHWMGEEEIYADMLKDCFDITLSPASDGQDEGGICEICITQLRNAANFKKQVLHTDEQFKNKLQSGYFKPEIVKVELPGEDGIDSDDNNASVEEGYSGPEFEVPIKAESPEESKPKKRAAKKGPTTRAKKAKTDAEDAETSTKRVQRKAIVANSDKKGLNTKPLKRILVYGGRIQLRQISELDKHRSNIRIVLQCSNATPIRCHGGIGYACCFCAEQFPDPADLKRHTIQAHDDKAKLKFMQGKMMYDYLVKLDITSLVCTICNTSIDALDQLIEHLIKLHRKPFYTDIQNHILSFKFDNDVMRCIFCMNVFNKFKALQEHMNVHYRNYICDVCDAGFVNRNILSSHTEAHKIGTFKCDQCPKIFDTMRKKKSHERSVHNHLKMFNKCGYCNQKFKDYRQKNGHLVKVHGVQLSALKCQACDKTFVSKTALTVHTKRDHLMERRHKCTQCDMRFFATNELKIHMVKHTGVREFKCDVCLKSYGRRKTLREHMRIHENDRRFKCEHCGQTFVQKCSWRGHMRNRHGDNV